METLFGTSNGVYWWIETPLAEQNIFRYAVCRALYTPLYASPLLNAAAAASFVVQLFIESHVISTFPCSEGVFLFHCKAVPAAEQQLDSCSQFFSTRIQQSMLLRIFSRIKPSIEQRVSDFHIFRLYVWGSMLGAVGCEYNMQCTLTHRIAFCTNKNLWQRPNRAFCHRSHHNWTCVQCSMLQSPYPKLRTSGPMMIEHKTE